MKKMHKSSRLIIAAASLGLIVTCFLPFWYVFLTAPQYPEGLTMYIWLSKLTGDVPIINELNHYIGMKHINASMFPELHYLIYAILFFVLFGLITAYTGKRSMLLSFIILLSAGGLTGIYDFYRWGYDYGHNLDPKAPIQIPGLSYQPPVLGHKALLNFDAYSYPDTGGWIIALVVLILVFVWIFERMTTNSINISAGTKTGKIINRHSAAAVILLCLFMYSCSVKPEPIAYGKDNCSFCKMSIVSSSFGGEVLTKKGRVYKFDDLHCLISFLKSNEVKPQSISQVLAVDYRKPDAFIDVSKAVFIQSPSLHTPMNGNALAAEDKNAAAEINKQVKGELTDWQTLYNHIN